MGKILYAFERLREPSSLGSISAMLAMVGMQIPQSTMSVIVNFLVVVFGVAGVWVKECAPETRIKGF